MEGAEDKVRGMRRTEREGKIEKEERRGWERSRERERVGGR